jgi:hypothetical protein
MSDYVKPKHLLIAMVASLMLIFSAGCTGEQQYTFFVTLGDRIEQVAEPATLEEAGRQLEEAKANWTPETATPAQNAVLTELSRQAEERQRNAFYLGIIASQQRPTDCISAMHQVFPASAWSWGQGIIMRESHNQPSAQNPSSSAAGCWQLLAMHDHRYYAVGCTPAQKYDALCNNKAAYHLYQAAGTSPWSL